MLRRYAMQSDRNLSELKREWNAMSNKERAKARLDMQSALGGDDAAEADSEK